MSPSLRVARRYLSSIRKMARTVYEDPAGVRWGWYSSDNIQRMYLRPIVPLDGGRKLVVWLEHDGMRSFEAEGAVEQVNLDPLRHWVETHRDQVELAWLRYCQAKGWLKHDVMANEIVLYPGTESEIRRSLLDVTGLEPFEAHWNSEEEFVRVEYTVNRLIWKADDGPEVGMVPFRG